MQRKRTSTEEKTTTATSLSQFLARTYIQSAFSLVAQPNSITTSPIVCTRNNNISNKQIAVAHPTKGSRSNNQELWYGLSTSTADDITKISRSNSLSYSQTEITFPSLSILQNTIISIISSCRRSTFSVQRVEFRKTYKCNKPKSFGTTRHE